MDQEAIRERLVQVLEHIARNERHIDEQRHHVAKLIDGGGEASEAKKLLELMERSLQSHLAGRDRLIAELITSKADLVKGPGDSHPLPPE